MNKDQIENVLKEKNIKINSVFNFLGSWVGRGKELFKKIDYTYVMRSAEYAKELGCDLFMHISA